MSSTHDNGARQTDRRTDPRLMTRLEAIIEDAEHGSLVFLASGFSRTGAFLQRRDRSAPLPTIGSTVHIVFHWPLETQMAPVRVEARVVRQTEEGVGVQFEIAA